MNVVVEHLIRKLWDLWSELNETPLNDHVWCYTEIPPPQSGVTEQSIPLNIFPELGYGYATGNCFRVCFNLKVHIASKTSFKLFKHTKLQYGVSCLLLKFHIQTSFQIDRFVGYLQCTHECMQQGYILYFMCKTVSATLGWITCT